MTTAILQAKLAEAEREERQARARLGDAALAAEQGDKSAAARKTQAVKDVQAWAERGGELREAISRMFEAAQQREADTKAATNAAAHDALAADLAAFRAECAAADEAFSTVMQPIFGNLHALGARIVATSPAVMKSLGRSEEEINTQIKSALPMAWAVLAYKLRSFPGVRCPAPFLDETRARCENFAPTMPAPKIKG